MSLHAQARGGFDQLGNHRERLGPKLARLALDGVRGEHEPGRVFVAHRLFDLGDGFRAILAEIANDPDESGSQLRAVLLE